MFDAGVPEILEGPDEIRRLIIATALAGDRRQRE
jgi:alkylation response protein AidB-like acyl-CoA dehydrogenase